MRVCVCGGWGVVHLVLRLFSKRFDFRFLQLDYYVSEVKSKDKALHPDTFKSCADAVGK